MSVWRGLTLLKLGRLEAAAADFAAAIRLQSHRPQSHWPHLRAYALIGRALISRTKGDHAQAAVDMETAMAIDPEAAARLAKKGFA